MTDRPKDIVDALHYPGAWAGHVLDRPEPDLEINMSIKNVMPGIAKAALEIALDNGGINAQRTEDDLYADLDKFIANRLPTHTGLRGTIIEKLQGIDAWLSGLPKDALLIVCAGEESDAAEVLSEAPPGTDMLLNEIFETIA